MLVKNFIDENDLKENKEAFYQIDVDHSGTIDEDECLEKARQINEEAGQIIIKEEDVR